DNPALGVLNLNGSGIPARQRFDVRDQFWFIEKPPFLVGEDAVFSEVFLPGDFVAGSDGVVKLLSTADQLVLRNRHIGCTGESYRGEECNQHESHTPEERIKIGK